MLDFICIVFAKLEGMGSKRKIQNEKIHVFVKYYAPAGNRSEKVILSTKVKIRVTRSLTLVSFEGHQI